MIKIAITHDPVTKQTGIEVDPGEHKGVNALVILSILHSAVGGTINQHVKELQMMEQAKVVKPTNTDVNKFGRG